MVRREDGGASMIGVTSTWMRSPVLPKLSLRAAIGVQNRVAALLEAKGADDARTREGALAKVVPSTVLGFTTPAVRDVGGASLRVGFEMGAEDLCDPAGGGFLLAVRSKDTWLPAIAGVPGEQGLDRNGKSRLGLGELMILARPLVAEPNSVKTRSLDEPFVTFLPEETLSALYPLGTKIDVIALNKLTDFFLGLNAGRWLTIRMNDLCCGAGTLKNELPTESVWCHEDLLTGSNLKFLDQVAPPPEDKDYLFHHWALSGNGGVSGQRIRRN